MLGLSLQQLRLAQTFAPVVRSTGRKLPNPLPSFSVKADSEDGALQLQDLFDMNFILEIKPNKKYKQLRTTALQYQENVETAIASESVYVSKHKKSILLFPTYTHPLNLPIWNSCPYVFGLFSFLQSSV